MKLGRLSLACVLGLSTFLFAGCTNNGMTTKNANPARMMDGNDRTQSADRTGPLRAPGYNRSNYFGASGYRTNSLYGTDGVTRFNGPTATPGYGMRDATGLGSTGNGTNGTGLFGTGLFGGNGTTGTNGDGWFGTNRTGTNRDGWFGTSGTNGFGTTSPTPGSAGFGSVAPGGSGTVGTSSPSNRVHGLSVTNQHVLQLGNLTIVGSRNGVNRADGTSRTSNVGGVSGMSASRSGSFASMTGQTGTTFRVLRVTDRKAVEAIDRVNRTLSSPSMLHAKSDALAKDLSYILKKASQSTAGATNSSAARTGAGR